MPSTILTPAHFFQLLRHLFPSGVFLYLPTTHHSRQKHAKHISPTQVSLLPLHSDVSIALVVSLRELTAYFLIFHPFPTTNTLLAPQAR